MEIPLTPPNKTQFCGAIALLGRPNAGKSTLLNALIGQKIAGVSKKPQTTRNRILGIVTRSDHQMLVLDTPGIHKTEGLKRLNRMMVREAYRVLDEACATAYLVDVVAGFTDKDKLFLERVREATKEPVVIFVSQVDKKPKSFVEERYKSVKKAILEAGFSFPCYRLSAKRAESLEEFFTIMSKSLPESPFIYAKDDMTDRSQKFVVSELIRETMFRCLGQEIPYHAASVIEGYSETENLVRIDAAIVVSRETQKGMVVGKRGVKIKEIGQISRENIEAMVGKKVFLNLHVKVENRWVDEKAAITELLELPK